jgi:hypothetical protein
MPEFSAPSNYKDETKITESIAAQRATWMEKAALSAVSGKVLVIGLRREGITWMLDSEHEGENLKLFWGIIEECVRERRIIVGFNIERFDFPFLVRRSWLHGVPVPDGIFCPPRGYLNSSIFIDLMTEWGCGDRQDRISLGTLAKFLGLGEKNGDGNDFHILWATERKLAVAYLENDLALCARIMERLLGVSEISAPSSAVGPQTRPSGRGEAKAAAVAAAPLPSALPDLSEKDRLALSEAIFRAPLRGAASEY